MKLFFDKYSNYCLIHHTLLHNMSNSNQHSNENSTSDVENNMSNSADNNENIGNNDPLFPEALKISEDARLKLLSFFRKQFSGGDSGKCFFRRVSDVSWLNKPFSITKNIDPDTSIPVKNFAEVSKSDRDRYVEVNVPFAAFTLTQKIRDEPKEVNQLKIRLPHTNYSQLDLTLDYTFDFSNNQKLCRPTTPLTKDLVFIYMSNNTLQNVKQGNTQCQPTADKWFIASEQFLRAWTSIMYDWHDTFNEIVSSIIEPEKKEEDLRNKLFGGNRLMTNTWLKYKMAINHPLSLKESREKYWHLRGEIASKDWVDIYCAIVLITRYGELPCQTNLPDYKGKDSSYGVEIHRSFWHLPIDFVSRLIDLIPSGLICPDNIKNYTKWTQDLGLDTGYFLSSNGHKGVVDFIPSIHKDNIIHKFTQRQEDSPEYRVFQTIHRKTGKEEQYPVLSSTTKPTKPTIESLGERFYNSNNSSKSNNNSSKSVNNSSIKTNNSSIKTNNSSKIWQQTNNSTCDICSTILYDEKFRLFNKDLCKRCHTEMSDSVYWSNILKTLNVTTVDQSTLISPQSTSITIPQSSSQSQITCSISPRNSTDHSTFTFTSTVSGDQEITVETSENSASGSSPRKITITQTTSPLKSKKQTPTKQNNQKKLSPNNRRDSNKLYKVLMSISWVEAEKDENY